MSSVAGPILPKRVSRRAALKAAVVSGAIASVGGTVAWLRGRGYDDHPARRLLALTYSELVVVEHAARRIAAPDRPNDRTIPSADEVDVAGFVDSYVARMAPPMRRDLSRALLYLEQLAPLAIGRASRFTHLSADDQDRTLLALEASPVTLLRGAFAGIKSLVFMGYYRDARTWGILGYEGPWVGRVGAGRGAPLGGQTSP